MILPAVFRSSGRCLRWGAATSARGASTVAMFNEKLQLDLLFLDDIIALRATAVFPENSLLITARPKNPQEVCIA